MNDKELVDVLNNPEEHYPGNFDTPQMANALLTGLCQEAATEIERLRAIEEAAKNLVKVKGRYHTEQAFNKLKELMQ